MQTVDRKQEEQKKYEKEQGKGIGLSNRHWQDSNAKTIFGNNVLCAQFLRDYSNVPCLANVQPEDLEDVSERYVTLYEEERNSDTVKKVKVSKNLKDTDEITFYIISLIEHKTYVDYNVIIQILRYMLLIWTDFAEEQEKMKEGISKRKEFRYPPILPIVYYEGKAKWTAPMFLHDKIMCSDLLGKYIPDFTYELVNLQNYSGQALLEKKDEISLVMLLNKMQSKEDISEFRNLPKEDLDEILRDTPEYLLDIIADVFRSLLLHMNMPVDETEEAVARIKEKKMGYLFENAEKMDIQLERRLRKEAEENLEKGLKAAQEAAQEAVQEAAREAAREAAQKAAREAIQQTEERDVGIMVVTLKEVGMDKNYVQNKLVEKYGLDLQTAQEKTENYWKYDIHP